MLFLVGLFRFCLIVWIDSFFSLCHAFLGGSRFVYHLFSCCHGWFFVTLYGKGMDAAFESGAFSRFARWATQRVFVTVLGAIA